MNEEPTKINYPIAGYAPGNYGNKCRDCRKYFTGDKYATTCEPCAINSIVDSNKKAISELVRIKSIISNMKSATADFNILLGE